MSSRGVELDAIAREATKGPMPITLRTGETYEGPAELPFPAFRALGKLAGLDADDPAAMSPVLDALDTVMVALIGEEAWAREAPLLSADEVMRLLQRILVEYGFVSPDAEPDAALGESRASASS